MTEQPAQKLLVIGFDDPLKASEFMLTMYDHFAVMRQKSTDGSWRSRLSEDVIGICKQALVLHGNMQASRAAYYVLWPAPGAAFDSKEMASEAASPQPNVAYTIHPGFRLRKCHGSNGANEVAVKAIVRTM